MGRWVRLDAEANVKDVRAFDLEGTRLAVFRTDEGFRAVADICSHEFALLSEGEVWDGQVYCPKHGSAFDLATASVPLVSLNKIKLAKRWASLLSNAGLISLRVICGNW